jgi:hypothetical protein
MKEYEITFMGGPMDGKLMIVPGEGQPPPYAHVVVPQRFEQMMDAKECFYQRQVSQLDDGPFWVYVPMEYHCEGRGDDF